MSDEAVVVSEDYPATRRAVFVAYTFYAQPYLDYDEPGTPEEFRNSSAMIPMVLMTMRWDGRLGFIGGFAEDGVSVQETLSKELAEEAGIALPHASTRFSHASTRFSHVVSHHNEMHNLRVSLYHFHDLAIKTRDEVSMMIVRASHAPHFLSEGMIVPVHLKDYGKGKGLPALLKNNLAFAVKEELEELVKLVPCPPSTALPAIVSAVNGGGRSSGSLGMRYLLVNLGSE